MVFPSRDHFTRSAPVERCVNCFASPPSIDSRYTSEVPLRDDRNAIVFPSRDHPAEESSPLSASCSPSPRAVLNVATAASCPQTLFSASPVSWIPLPVPTTLLFVA